MAIDRAEIERMTPSEFETRIFENELTLEEYEQDHLKNEVAWYQDFKFMIFVALDLMKKKYNRSIFGKKRLIGDIESAQRIVDLLYDPDVEFTIFDHDFIDDMRKVGEYIGDDGGLCAFNSMKRVYLYTVYKKLDVRDVMKKYTEFDYALNIKTFMPDKFERWCELFPEKARQLQEQQSTAADVARPLSAES